MFNVGPTNSPLVAGGGGGAWGGGTRRPPHTAPQRFDMRGPGMGSNMSPDAGLSMIQRMRMAPPQRVPQSNMPSMPGGGGMPLPRMGMPGPMMDAEPGGMFGNVGPSNGGLDIMKLTGGTNSGIIGPRSGGLWQNYANMVQGDGAPQRRNLTY